MGLGPHNSDIAAIAAGEGLEHLRGERGTTGAYSGIGVPRWDEVPTVLERRVAFEKAHPEVKIIPPSYSEGREHWTAEWQSGDGRMTKTRNDAHTFFDLLEEIFC